MEIDTEMENIAKNIAKEFVCDYPEEYVDLFEDIWDATLRKIKNVEKIAPIRGGRLGMASFDPTLLQIMLGFSFILNVVRFIESRKKRSVDDLREILEKNKDNLINISGITQERGLIVINNIIKFYEK